VTEAPARPETRCTGCGTVVVPDAPRCPACGIGHPTRVLARAGIWAVGFTLLVAWVLTLLFVASAR
jgi:transposase